VNETEVEECGAKLQAGKYYILTGK